jgi:glucose-1-phosphate cytidylyltransferase
MKVVLFCGGQGMRMREHSETLPKPMATIGYRPILWHLMKYYAHFGHKDFILCLGWKANLIKEYFLKYDECMSNDFVLSGGGNSVELLGSDIQDWNITFIDTGTSLNIGQRLRAVRPFVENEDTFLANYTDGLTDLRLPNLIDLHRRQQAVATFLAVRPRQSFHNIATDEDGTVSHFELISEADVWMNGGYFVLSNRIFDFLHEGEELVEEPFARLMAQQRLSAMRYDGFWSCMDTYKEKQDLDDRYAHGNSPWEVWKRPNGSRQPAASPLASPLAALQTSHPPSKQPPC